MFTRNNVTYEFHHMGFPTEMVRPGERFSARFGMYTSDGGGELFPIQWHRYLAESSLHPLIRTVPHSAFKVSNLDRAIEGLRLLLAPYEPIDGYRVAIVAHGGTPVELIETSLTDEELWRRARTGEEAPLYREPVDDSAAELRNSGVQP